MNGFRPTLIAAVCAAALFLGACGGSSGSDDSTQADSATMGSTQSSGSVGDAVSIKDFAYAPPSLTINKGTTVSFTNNDTTEHTATASGGGFDTGSIAAGKTKSVTLDSSGTFAYVCTFHPFMHGTITVK
jgi:plastocyanin